MDKIEVAILNADSVFEAEKLTVLSARLTQRGHKVSNMSELLELYNRDYGSELLYKLASMPHPNIQRQAMISVAMVGVSRRFWSQITRHQDDVHFVGGSLQYSDYSNVMDVVVPYEIMQMDADFVGNAALEEGYHKRNYLNTCIDAIHDYSAAIAMGVPQDAAGYMAPYGMRQIGIMSATAWQWKHMISQRVCRRNSLETQYVMLLIWEKLAALSPDLFDTAGPFCCQKGGCQEGHMSCGHFFHDTKVDDEMHMKGKSLPTAFLDINFPLIRNKEATV